MYPTQNVSEDIKGAILDYTKKLALAIGIKGMINIQFIEFEGQLYVIEVNPRASRTVPYISKVSGVPIVDIATKVMLGSKLKDLGYGVDGDVSLFFDTDKDVSEWEFSAIYDLFNVEALTSLGYIVEEFDEEYNPTWLVKFKFDENYHF